MANEFAGSALVLTWVWSGGTATLNTDSRNFNYAPTIEWIDSTAGADTARQRIESFKDGNARCSILAKSNDGTALYNALAEGVSGTLIYGPAGTASGCIKRTIPMLSQGITDNVPYADVVTYDVSWIQNGARTDANY